MSATLPFNYWVAGETTTHKDIGAVYYNTGLSVAEASIVQNAVMTIYLRVLMEPIGGSEKIKDVNDKDMAIKDWNAATGEFQAFKAEVKEQAESFWNDNTVCMVPPKYYTGLNWPPGRQAWLRLNIDCKFELVWASGPRDAHKIIRCARLADDAADSSASRSHWKLYDSGDCKAVIFNLTTNCGTPIAVEHLTVPHEIGHAIGLPHVGVFHDLTKSEHQCKVAGIDTTTTRGWETPGADGKGGKDPYGNYSSEDVMRNIMGYGQGKALWNFLPWINRAHAHTCFESHISDWRFSSTWVPPQTL